MTEPTPGEWRADANTVYVVNPDKRGDLPIAAVLGRGLTSDEIAANARLMAASKQMLGALEAVLAIDTEAKVLAQTTPSEETLRRLATHLADANATIDQVCEAVAAARGESSD